MKLFSEGLTLNISGCRGVFQVKVDFAPMCQFDSTKYFRCFNAMDQDHAVASIHSEPKGYVTPKNWTYDFIEILEGQ